MGNDDQGIIAGVMKFLEDLDQVTEAPQVNTGFRFIEDRKRRGPGNDGGNLDTFQLAA